MEIISRLNTEKKSFNYLGKGTEFAIVFFKNILLTILTLGLYYPWAKTKSLKYHYQSTELESTRFTFNGTGKEAFKGFIKVYVIVFLFYILIIYGSLSRNTTVIFLTFGLFYLFFLLLTPFAIHGSARYKSSRSSWKGIHFKYLGDRMELFWKFLSGFLLTFFTLGIYGSWFSIDIKKYILSHLRFGNLSFDFKGSGETLFWMNLKFILLFPLTIGIYSFWHYKNLWKFYADNTEITQNGNKVNFQINMTPGDLFGLMIVNLLIIILTLGIGYPWVKVRTLQFIFRFLEIEEGLNTNTIQQISYDDYGITDGDNFLDFLDINLI